MHKKISVGLTVAITALTLIITALVTTAVTMSRYGDLVSFLPEKEAMYGGLAEIDNLIRNEYFGDADAEGAVAGVEKGYIESLKTGENIYMTAEEYESYKKTVSGISPEDGKKLTSVTYKKFGSAGYIKISEFYNTTADEFKDACNVLRDNSVTGIVIDVRDTDSINIKSAADIIDLIVPLAADKTEAIATAAGKNGNNAEIFSADSAAMDLPFAVIVNEKTKGAGELIAADLRDFGKAVTVGKTTAGRGTYQKLFELSNGGAVVLTVAELLPYGGESYDGTGVKPDYEVNPSDKTDDLNNDSQFLKAYAAVAR